MVIAQFRNKGAHAVNMEPSITNPGIPDVNFCLEGILGDVELKFGYAKGAAPLVRPGQIVWFRERIRAGGYPMLAYYVEDKEYTDEVMIFQGRHIEDLAEAKDIDEIYDIEYLRVINPEDIVEALISEMASWHDEMHPQIMTLN